MKKAIVTLHPDYNGSRIELIKWVRNNLARGGDFDLSTAIELADTLLKGKPLEFTNAWTINTHLSGLNPYCKIVVEDDEIVAQSTEKDEYLEMAKYGANGNTLLAIKFCQDVIAGKVKFLRHVACGG